MMETLQIKEFLNMRCSSKRTSILLALLAGLVNAPAARAQYGGGQWTGPYFSSTGYTSASVSTTTFEDRNKTFFSAPWTLSPTLTIPSYLPGYNYFSLNGDQAFSTFGSGTYTVTYIYKNYYTQQQMTPPLLQSKVYLKEVSGVSWSAVGYNNGLLIAGAGNADNGRKDPDVVSADQTGGISGGTHLVQQDGSSGLVQFNVSPSASSGLCLFGMLGAHGAAGTVFNYQWQLDTRSVTIVCAPLENGGNFHKGAGALPGANVRNSDGSITVDSIYTFTSDTSASTDNFWFFDQWLSAQTTGFDVTTRNLFGLGNLSNTTFEWTPPIGNQTADKLASIAGSFSDLPKSYGYHVKVTDLRPFLNAIAENDYTIRIHKYFENGAQTASPVFGHNESYDWSPEVYGNAPAPVDMVGQQPHQWSIYGQSFLSMIGAGLSGICGSGALVLVTSETGPIAPVLADMIFNVAGWIVTNSTTPAPSKAMKTVTADYDAFTKAISDQSIINVDGAFPNINDIIDCPDDPRIVCNDSFDQIVANPLSYWNSCVPLGKCHSGARYIIKTVTGDAYGTNGYIGQQTNHYVVFDRYLNNVWQWRLSTMAGTH